AIAQAAPAKLQRGALLLADLDVLQIGFELRLIDSRTDIDARLAAVADFEFRGALDQRLHEAVVDRILDDGAARGRALLAGREERAVHRLSDRRFEIGVGEDDGWVLAAHLELNPQTAPRCSFVQPLTDAAGASERYGFQRRSLDERFAQFPAR